MQTTLFDVECPSSAEYQEPLENRAEYGHSIPASVVVDYCPSTRTAVLRSGYVVKGVRVRCKAKRCPACGPLEWRLHTAGIRVSAEAGESLYFLEVEPERRAAFHKRVKRAGAEAKYVPTFRGVFLCVTTLPEGRCIEVEELEALLMDAFEESSRVGGNVTGTRGWKKAAELEENPRRQRTIRNEEGWTLVGYSGMSPEKTHREVLELGEQLPQLHVRETKNGWTTHCTDPGAVERLLKRTRVLGPEDLADRRSRRQSSDCAVKLLTAAA